MRFLGVLILIVALGFGAWWFLGGASGRDQIRDIRHNVSKGATEAEEAVRDKLHNLNFSTDDLKDELSRTGQVVREKADKLRSKNCGRERATRELPPRLRESLLQIRLSLH